MRFHHHTCSYYSRSTSAARALSSFTYAERISVILDFLKSRFLPKSIYAMHTTRVVFSLLSYEIYERVNNINKCSGLAPNIIHYLYHGTTDDP